MTSEANKFTPVQKLIISEVLIVIVISASLLAYKTLDAQKPVVEQKEIQPTNLNVDVFTCLLYTSPSPRDRQKSRMPSSA